MSYPPAPSSHHQHHAPPHEWAHHPVASTSTSFPAYDPPRFAYSRDADPRPALADPYGQHHHHHHHQRDHQPASASTLTPPSSFGGFGFRRARSSGALPTLQPAALHEQSLHAYAAFPPSPVSPNYPHGDASAGQQQQQQQRPASALSSWRAPPADPSCRDAWAPGPSTYAHESAYSSSSGSWAQQQPQTPPPSARFRRTSSAQPSFAAPSTTPSSPSRPGSAYSARGSTALGAHDTSSAMGYSSSKFQHSSPEEINQFLNDMSEILGPDALAALSPTSSVPPPRRLDPRPAPSVTVQPPAPVKKQATYNVSGVLLDEDEYRAFAESPSSSRQPSPVHASSYDDRPQQGRPPFGGSTYREPAYTAPSYEAWSGGYLAPSQVDIQRPASAPPTPVLDLEASSSWTQFAPYGSTYQSPVMRSTAAMNRRRGSSFDASSIPRIYSSGLVGLQPLTEDAYPRFNAGLGFDDSVQAFEPQQPQRRALPPPACQSSFRPGPDAYAVPPPPPQQQQQQHSSTPSPASSQRPPRQQQAREQPQRPPQPEPTTPVRRPKAKTSISFLNFSAADSKQLLGGVAPSGSSKKRARDDEHSPAQKKEKRAA